MATPKKISGIQFPMESDTQKPSTSKVGKAILHAALNAVGAKQAVDILKEKSWRKNYPYYFRTLVQHQISSTKNAIVSAEAGLAVAEQSFLFIRDTQKVSLVDAMDKYTDQPFEQFTLQGNGSEDIAEWGIPYQGKFLTGQALLTQLELWESNGIIDQTHAQALKTIQQHPEWFDLSDRTVVLFGAASEAGPLTWLSKWKANIIALDLPQPKIWEKIKNTVEQGNATLIAPIQKTQHGEPILGADLLQQTPEIANWLATFKTPLDLAGIAYLDGEKHVRVSMAMIAIMKKVSQLKSDSSLMFMLTPTDIYAIPKRVLNVAARRKTNRPSVEKVLSKFTQTLTQSKFFKPHDESVYAFEKGQYAISDCMVLEQGPNYALAKRLQQWYAIVARHHGQHVSINIAPSTTTQSVVKNPLLKAAFDGAYLFDVEAFSPETTNAIMAAIWVYDLRSKESLSNVSNELEHPLQLIMNNANHGGLWNVPYLVRSALPFSAIYGWSEARVSKFLDIIKK